MKCLKIGRHHCFLFLFSSFVSIVFCSLFLVSPSFAIEDLSVTFTPESGIQYSTPIFAGTSLTKQQVCEDYKYLIVSPIMPVRSLPSGTNVYSNVSAAFGMANLRGFTSYTYSETIIEIPECPANYSSNNYILPNFSGSPNFSSILQSGESITYTLTDHLPSDSSDCPVCPDEPSGELAITSNGTYDVTNYASVDVDVPETVVQGDYHNDLQDLKHSVIICGAILLVIYFFYCIYRMFFRTLGGV